jgi:Fungal specific transcription factor domain
MCEGYSNSKSAVEPAIQKADKGLIMIHYTANLPVILNTSTTRNSKEQRSLEYFRTRTAPDLVSCFASELWTLYVLQLAHNEPAVRHVVIAIGCLHEQLESAAISPHSDSRFALKQYTKSIQHLIGSFNPCSGQSTDIALLLCALFASFESLQGHYQSALTHIISGMKVLEERPASDTSSSRSHIPARFLDGLFNRLGAQVLEINDMSIKPLQSLKQSCLEDLPIPCNYSTIEEAQDALNLFLYKFNHFLSHAEGSSSDGLTLSPAQIEDLLATHAVLALYFQLWAAAFEKYLVRTLQVPSSHGRPPSIPIEPGVYILQMWREMINVWLSLDTSTGEKAWDPFVQQFSSITDLAATFLDQSVMSTARPSGLQSTPQRGPEYRQAPHSSTSAFRTTKFSDPEHEVHPCAANIPPLASRPLRIIKPTFSLSLGIIPPLYIVSSRCRDPVIRRRAIHLLSICNRREGIWDALLGAHVARRILETEEAGARQYLRAVAEGDADGDLNSIEITSMLQIPEHVRVVILWTSFGPGRQGMVRFKKSTQGSEGLGHRENVDEAHFDW